MKPLEPFLNGTKAPGLWSYEPGPINDATASLDAPSIRRVGLHGVRDKQELFDRLESALRFPEWFGYNWDALADWSTEPDWLAETTPTLVVLAGVRSIPEPLATTFFEIMESTTRYWAKRGRIVYVLGDVESSPSAALTAFRT